MWNTRQVQTKVLLIPNPGRPLPWVSKDQKDFHVQLILSYV